MAASARALPTAEAASEIVATTQHRSVASALDTVTETWDHRGVNAAVTAGSTVNRVRTESRAQSENCLDRKTREPQ